MAKYFRREEALSCPVHMAVLEKCYLELAERGYFSKEEVIGSLSLKGMSDAIRWDYIREFIMDGKISVKDEDTGEIKQESGLAFDLIPVVARFFQTHITDKSGHRTPTVIDRVQNPSKYLAKGYGKRTAGFCSVTIDQGVLAVQALKYRRTLSNGVGEAFNQFAERLAKRKLLDSSPHASPIVGAISAPLAEGYQQQIEQSEQKALPSSDA